MTELPDNISVADWATQVFMEVYPGPKYLVEDVRIVDAKKGMVEVFLKAESYCNVIEVNFVIVDSKGV